MSEPDPPTDAAHRKLFHHGERVPLVYWRQLSGARTTVLLVAGVAVLSFVTGLSHISRGTAALDGPLGPVLVGAGPAGRFAGLLVGGLLAAAAVGLERRLRVAWWGAVALLPLASLAALATAEPADVPLFLLGLAALPAAARNRERFDRPLDLTPFQVAAVGALAAVQVYGTVGAYALREQYTGIGSWTDAFYYIVVTGTTVGYGDATPVTQEAKLFTLSVLVLGTAAFGAAFGSLLVPALEARVTAAFGNMTASDLALLEDHVVVLGYGDLTEPLLDELDEATDAVVVTPDTDRASALDGRGVEVLTADPTDETALREAGIGAASGVVAATDDDARDTLAVLAARRVAPEVRVVAAASEGRHADKLREVGADEVITPAAIGGRLLGRSVLGADRPDDLFDGGRDPDAGGGSGLEADPDSDSEATPYPESEAESDPEADRE